MERPSGPPLGAATQSTGRPMTDSGASRPAPLTTSRKIPNSTATTQHVASSSSSSTRIPISAGQVVALAREAMKLALDENQTKAAEASGVSNELKPGVTIDLSHKEIQRFPDEVVDVIKNELERTRLTPLFPRLALSHNQISTFPSRFSECTSLRYLNVRNNVIREFPQSICELTSLEILDLGRNKLRVLPPELVKLTSLKVLSVQKNRIEELPLCLADMTTLQVLKLDGNPIHFPPKEILQPISTPPQNDRFQESEVDEISITFQIKRFLKQKMMSDRSETESGGEESSEGTETPRPIKRVMSGRFPIKVNGTDMPDLRSPALPRAPPIPSRSHYRGLSQQNAALRRPGVLPLTIGMANERLRSNSENLLQVSRDRAPSDRTRRMGIVSRKASDLGTVDETKTNRHSHYRGLSHGSAMQGGSKSTNGTINSRSPASPADSANQKGVYVRRLSSLPERKRVSMSPDPVIEGATGILFALFQVHPQIQTLLDVVRDGTNKRTSLERVFYNASTHVEELDRDIQNYITYSEEDEEAAPRSNENVHSACLTCVGAYIHVCALLSRNVDTLLANGDPRYIRHLLLLIYGSLAEIRNAGASLFSANQRSRYPEAIEETLKVPSRDKSITPTRDWPRTIARNRSATVVQHPSNLRVATDARPPYLNGAGRATTMTSATPRSGESFASTSTSGGRVIGDFTEEDRIFEKIFLRLQQSSENSLRSLPEVRNHFINAMTINSQSSNPEQSKQFWQILIQKTQVALENSNALKGRLSLIKLKEPGIRTQAAFWELCSIFIQSYTELVMKVKEAKNVTTLLSTDVIVLLRPLQKVIKETSQLIQASPWSYLATLSSSNSISNASAYTSQSPASQIPLPMTPQSAALGPAVQATVPSTPQSATYNAMFSGNVFERADAYLSMNGGSVASSRNGTMTSASLNDGSMTPASGLSPLNSSNSRFNGNGKMAF
ncbi:Leucine-rich repeat-containing sog2 [Hyphodiscus hymeniophilus]|uniref:Leucine-rich repeat-containing sog2 n=1 Tax=Hyphodiscus hymeniophilus TaxID=353542 RepID=A0A9P6VPX7_9HELO|nr:Leucine-rich repeat-containing sog2 [Hyphodiscus hymeniophilus]